MATHHVVSYFPDWGLNPRFLQFKNRILTTGMPGKFPVFLVLGFLGGSGGKESTFNAGDLGSIPGFGRSPGEENVYPLQYSGLENSMDRGAWKIIDHVVAKSPDMTERLSPSLPLLLLPRGGTSGKEAASQCSRGGRPRFHPGVGKILEAGHGNPL